MKKIFPLLLLSEIVLAIYSQVVFGGLKELLNSDFGFYLDVNRGYEWNYILNKEEEILPWLWSKTKI
ncbi:hypothetical protein [Portibacter lacus]|uniref:Uncharacterized protein n=1 Tax=Portibacter lacus TaxID=1099794 RepID=A0AA37SQJ0_9BACT|nr:hypothetical protein [Portibacter lacus]GLR17559.1 hypothetical protein GCM10007940_21740 [Portibacter lacus]